MGLFDKLKKFAKEFVPSEEEGKRRRLKWFGTESKAVAGALIGAGAVTAIAVGPGIGTTLGGRTLAKRGLTTLWGAVKSLPTKYKVAGIIGAPIVAGAIVSKPERVTKAPASGGRFVSNLYEFGKDPSLEKAKDIFRESPVLSTAGIVAGAGALGLGGFGAGALAGKAFSGQGNQGTGSQVGIPVPPNAVGFSAPVPTTPQTQNLPVGRTGTGVSRARRAIKKTQNITHRVNVNVINNSRVGISKQTKRYIYS